MHVGRTASHSQRDTRDDYRETEAWAVMVAEAVMVPEASTYVPPRMVAEAWPCVPPRLVGPMAPLLIAPHTITAPGATVASALNLLDYARLCWGCKRGDWHGYRRCWGSPKQQHGAADQPGVTAVT